MLLEVAVDDALGLQAAVEGGADRIELCAALDLGGLTPSLGLMRHARGCGLPVFAMIRPRAGGFCYAPAELAVMRADIAAAADMGLSGVVFGVLTPDLSLDGPEMQRLIAASGGMQVTLHRAFDMIPDWRRAVDQAADLGIARILTSGAALSAPEGAARLAEVFAYAAGRITILPGAGISAETYPALRHLPMTEIHASCAGPIARDESALAFGFASSTARRTNLAKVRALKAVLLH